MKTKTIPMMYKGWLIIDKQTYIAISNPAKQLDINIQFKSWKQTKEFIDICK
jgi:hypothetical protein